MRRRSAAAGMIAMLATMTGATWAGEPMPGAPAPAPAGDVPAQWWAEGEGRPLPAFIAYPNRYGTVGLLNTAGPVDTAGHPFFEPIGSNGRACVTCHQPADGMSLAAETARQRWQTTDGKDPLFAGSDARDCPDQPVGEADSYSLLLARGLFRVALPWPPADTEFDIEVVSDPTGCNTHPRYGLDSPTPTVSVYRRPRVMANLRYVTAGGALFNIKDGSLMEKDPDTGEPVSMQLMADARLPTLKAQANDAGHVHLEMARDLTDPELAAIREFQDQLYMAQYTHAQAGLLGPETGATGLGPRAMADGEFGLGDTFANPVFGRFDAWRDSAPEGDNTQLAFRRSVARGSDVFFLRPVWIKDVSHLNSIGLGNPIKRSCATCHNARNSGMDLAPGWMDLGTTNLPWANTANNIRKVRNPWAHAHDLGHGRYVERNPPEPTLPVFKLTCKPSALPHPYLGREIYSHDPGRALISGKCRDIGAITMQQMRGLAARAPYFSNGSAATLRDLVEFYDQRFDAQYSEQEKQDLVNFLSTL